VGWLLLLVGIGVGLSVLVDTNVRSGTAPLFVVSAWLSDWGLFVWLTLAAIFLPLVFPNGRLVSRRWKPVLWLGVVAVLAMVIGAAFEARPLDIDSPRQVDNPIGIEAAGGVLSVVRGVADVLLAVSFVLAAASLVVRFRRSRGSERQQLKWFAYVGLIAAAGLSLLMAYVVFANEEGKDVASWVDALGVLGWFTALLTILIGLPVATGIAILRHRLYDIDVIIRRTLVYGALTATLAACYVGSVLLLPAGAEPRIGLRHRRVYAGGGGPVSACELEDPGAGGPSLLPTPLRRRPDAGALQRAAARRGRSRRGRQRAARGRRGNRSTRTRLAVVSARRAGAHSRRGIVSTTEGPVLTARRFVWGAWALCVSIALPTLVFLALGLGETTPADEFGLTGAGGLAFLVAALAFATTGALVATRVPSNRIGWIFCLIGFVMTAGNLPYQYADDALYLAPGSLPGGVTAAVLQNLGLPSAFACWACPCSCFPMGACFPVVGARPPARG
jgi:predicted permease